MPDDKVQVSIIADSAGYVSGTKAAVASTDQLKVSAGQMAEALKAAGGDLSKVSPALLGIGTAARDAATAISAAAPAAAAATNAMSGLAKVTSGETVELIRIGHEAMTGNFSRIPGSLVVLASRMGGLGAALGSVTPAMIGAGGAAAVFAGGLALIEMHAAKVEGVLETMKDAFAGNDIFASDAQIKTVTEALQKVPGITDEATSKLTFAFAQMKGATVEGMGAIADLIPSEMKRTGLEAAQAGETLVKGYEKALTSANPQQAVAQFFGQARDAMLRERLSGSEATSLTNLSEGQGVGGIFAQQIGGQEQSAQIQKTVADISAAMKSLQSVAATPVSVSQLEKFADVIKATGGTATQTAQALVSFWQQARANAEVSGGDIIAMDQKISQSMADLARAQTEAARQASEAATRAGEAAISVARDQASAIAANDKLSAAQRLGFEAQLWGQLRDGEQITAAQKIEVNREVNDVLAQLNRQRVDDATKAATQISQSDAATLRYEIDGAKQILEENKRDAEQTARAWNDALNSIDGTVSTFLGDVISRHETAAAAAKSAIDKLVTSWITGIAEIMVKLVAFEVLEKVSGIGGLIGGAAGSGAAALGGSLAKTMPGIAGMFGIGGGGSQMPNSASDPGAQSVEQLAQLVSIGNQQLSSGSSLLSGVTQSGSTLVGMATTAASGFGSMIESGAKQLLELVLLVAKPSFLGTSYAVGTASVPHDMLAMVHKGEIVIPADISAQLRSPSSMTVMGASAGNAGGGGAAPTGVSGAAAGSVTHNWNISAIDGASVQAFFNKYGTTVARTVSGVSAANPSITSPSY